MQKKKIDYQKIMETRNASNAFANLIGLKITEISDGHCTCEMDITDDMKNPIQSVHGGVLFTIADVTGGGAAASHGFDITTVDSSFHYLRPGIGTTKLTATARELKAGRNLLVYDVSVADQNNTVLAKGNQSVTSFLCISLEISSGDNLSNAHNLRNSSASSGSL